MVSLAEVEIVDDWQGMGLLATMVLQTGREVSTAAVSSGRRITEAEALRACRDMVYAQHQVGWALDKLCEMDGARWVYDRDRLGAIRRDVMTILTHHAAAARPRWLPRAKCSSPAMEGERAAFASHPTFERNVRVRGKLFCSMSPRKRLAHIRGGIFAVLQALRVDRDRSREVAAHENRA